MKRVLACIALQCLWATALGNPQVIYVPGDFPDTCARNLSTDRDYCVDGVSARPGPTALEFCSQYLQGLDVARRLFGMRGCSGGPLGDSDHLAERIDILLLVDDLSGLSAEARAALNLPRSRSHVDMHGRYARWDGGNIAGRLLIVGEHASRQMSQQQWIDEVREFALRFERGDGDEATDEQRFITIPYRATSDDFQREIEDALCPIMLCNEDGRVRMRELFGRHRDIASLHAGYAALNVGEGDPVTLKVLLTRQMDRQRRIMDIRFSQHGTEYSDEGNRVEGRAPSRSEILARTIDAGLDALRGRSEPWATEVSCVLRTMRAGNLDAAYYSSKEVDYANLYNRTPARRTIASDLIVLDPDRLRGENPNAPDESMRIGLRNSVYGNFKRGMDEAYRICATNAEITPTAVLEICNEMKRRIGSENDVYHCFVESSQ